MILYRPVSLQEMERIYDGGMKAFPARLPQQPIFYPVLDLEYARQTAAGWNAESGQSAGYVTEFKVEDEYISRFEPHTVGGSPYQEFWIPAEEVEELNRHLSGHIKVVEAHFGEAFQGFIPQAFALQGKNAVEQFSVLGNFFMYKRMDFYLEVKRNHKAVFLNYPYWQQHAFQNHGLKEKVLQAIREAWLASFPKIPLPPPPLSRQDSPPARRPDAVTEPPPEEAAPAEKTDPSAHLLPNPLQGDIPSAEPGVSHAVLPPAPEPVRPVKHSGRHFLGRSVQEQAPPGEQAAVHFSRGLDLALSRRYPEAIAEFSRAVEEEPNHVVALTSLGVAYHRLGQDDRALACYEAALRIDPIHAEAHYFRANLLYSEGSVREAITGYTIAMGLQPELVEAHQQPDPQNRLTDYSRIPAEMHWIARPARRILSLNRALETRPRQASLFNERAAEYSRLGNYVQAIADYSASLEIHPDDAGVLHRRGVAYKQLGRLDRASEDFQRAVAIAPQLVNEYIHRGVSLGNAGNLRQAIDRFDDAIDLAPQNPDGYFNRGTAYLRHGDPEKAIEDFSTVIRLAPKDEEAYYWRGSAYVEMGRDREAAADYRQFLLLSQNATLRQEIEQKLQRLELGRPGVAGQAGGPDLHDLLMALGERAVRSTWFAGGVECYGETAAELSARSDPNKPVQGGDLLRIASGIRQTLQGDFQAFDPGADSPWIFIRAWNGNGFYLETNDDTLRTRLGARFPSLEDVEGASPPYAGLFIPS